jgi:hypothetical protein
MLRALYRFGTEWEDRDAAIGREQGVVLRVDVNVIDSPPRVTPAAPANKK